MIAHLPISADYNSLTLRKRCLIKAFDVPSPTSKYLARKSSSKVTKTLIGYVNMES